MKFGIVVFPGSNCDHDVYHVFRQILGVNVEFIWHKETSLRLFDAIILPGGFSYGDYLRTGAIARFSPVMQEVIQYAKAGGASSRDMQWISDTFGGGSVTGSFDYK